MSYFGSTYTGSNYFASTYFRKKAAPVILLPAAEQVKGGSALAPFPFQRVRMMAPVTIAIDDLDLLARAMRRRQSDVTAEISAELGAGRMKMRKHDDALWLILGLDMDSQEIDT